jgi:hypothetical protein
MYMKHSRKYRGENVVGTLHVGQGFKYAAESVLYRELYSATALSSCY